MNKFFYLFLLILALNVQAGDVVVIPGGVDSPVYAISREVLREAYKKIGMVLLFKNIPQRRGIILANEGKLDGELMRIKGIEKKFKNLVMVDAPIQTLKMVATTKKSKVFKVEGVQSILDKRIGLIKGIIIAEKISKSAKERLFVGHQNKVLEILKKDRVDAILTSEVMIKGMLKKDPDAAFIKVIEEPVHRFHLYHYLHKKNVSQFKDKLEAVLKEMFESGRTAEIRKKFIDNL